MFFSAVKRRRAQSRLEAGYQTIVIPLKAADPDRVVAVLARAKALAKQRDPVEGDAALAAMGSDPQK